MFLGRMIRRMILKIFSVIPVSCVSLILTISFSHLVRGQASGDPTRADESILEPGKPVTSQVAGGESHRYRLVLLKGEHARVVLKQMGLDLTLRLSDTDGNLVATIDSDNSPDGTEFVSITTEGGGKYLLEAFPSAPKAGRSSYSIEVSDVRAATAAEKDEYAALCKYYEALRANEGGKTDIALDLAKASLGARESLFGSESKPVAYSLIAIGNIYANKNDVVQAEIAIRHALDVLDRSGGRQTPPYADGLYALGRVLMLKGDFKAAEEPNLEAFKLREKLAGPDSLPVAATLHSLGVIYRALNDLPRAERMTRRTLEIRERLLGEDHPDTANTLNNLGLLYYGAGDYVNAEPILLRSLAIKEKLFGPVHRQVGIALNNLGLVEWKKRDYPKADAYWKRGLAIFEAVDGPNSEGIRNILGNLGIIYKEYFKDYPQAEKYQLRALSISEKLAGEDSMPVAIATASLGLIYSAMQDYARAETFTLRALSIYEKVVGPNHHNTILALSTLARLCAIRGDLPRSLEYQKRIEAIEGASIPLNLTIGSERQKIAYFSQLRNPDRNITFLVTLAPDNTESRDLVITQILQRKGRILDALAQNLSEFRRRAGPDEQALFDKLGDMSAEISTFTIEGRKGLSPDEYERRISDLFANREKLEADVIRRTSGFYEPAKPVTLAAVQAVIPDDGALVEFAVYHPFEWKKGDFGNAYGAPRYIAFVIRRTGEAQWREIGPAKEIDSSVEALREALRDPARLDVRSLARTLDEKVMRPVRAIAGNASHLLIAPDGGLNLIPFEALVDEQNRYLVERFSFTYLSSGRELLRLGIVRPSRTASMVVVNPAFGNATVDFLRKTLSSQKASRRQVANRSVKGAVDLADTYFAPLSGTEQEARLIKSILLDATVLSGANATETALKETNSPKILHIATHGFFLNDRKSEAGSGERSGGEETAVDIGNPLLRSGLAFAGANRRSGKSDDGILTALEASGLNLWGTKLVVLSACDTGIGEVRYGEGVYGLRRAFTLAGAESLVMSMWPVSDWLTRDLMAGYYRNLKNGIGRGEALRKVELEMLMRPDRQHPFYWASFIQAGEWGNLEGKR